MDIMQKLEILASGAKYDAACTSSGAKRAGGGNMGSTVMAGCCHSFAADGRCISLLKVLMTNYCIYDCKYCVNRHGNDVPRTAFSPEDLAELTIQFYRRNYIEGLFLSSGVMVSPDYTTERMIRALELLRNQYKFSGYIHAKTIPGTSPELIRRLGLLADRLSVNVELPSERSLAVLAPDKSRKAIFAPMGQIAGRINENTQELALYRNAPSFASAGQATQMIIGATPETDYQILRLASGMYQKYSLKRVFYSAYIPTVSDSLLPMEGFKPPLLREHRLYQADWLLRQYGFSVDEILSEDNPNFNPFLDPKCNWAVNHPEFFPVDVNTASQADLMRIPGVGVLSARRIVTARRTTRLRIDDLKRMGVVLKRARYFILTADQTRAVSLSGEQAAGALMDGQAFSFGTQQISLFSPEFASLSQRDAANEALLSIAQAI